ncbi:MAG: hypothetical protein QXY84_01180 [Candidatus Caldarchaeum sp.]
MHYWKTAATLGAAFLVRLALAPFFGHSWDIYVWIRSGEMFTKGTDVYTVKSLTDFPWGFYTYPPLWLYWLGFANSLSSQFNNLNLYILMIKLPVLIADLVVAVLITKIAAEMNLLHIRGKASLLWLFNPLVILISAVWGMFDTIAVAFSLAGLLFGLRSRYGLAAFLLGIGAAVKIYPVLLMLPLLLYMKFQRQQPFSNILKTFAMGAAGVVIPAAPYLPNPVPLIEKLLYHFSNIGQFTYWMALAFIAPTPLIPVVSYGLFAAVLYVGYQKQMKQQSSSILFDLSLLTLLAFLATSSKVNVQYVLWVLPFLLIHGLRTNVKEFKSYSILLVVAGLVFITAAQAVLAIFDLRNIGRIVVSREIETVTWGGVFLVLSALVGGAAFLALLINLLKIGKQVWTVSRIALIMLFTVFVVVISVFPVGKGVVLPKAEIRVGVTEGVEALFDKPTVGWQSAFLEKVDLTHLVLPVGPEAVMYGGDYGKFFRFKLTNEEWTAADIRAVTSHLRSIRIKPLLGLYLKTFYVSVHYGIHGYNSTKFIENYSDCVDIHGNIYFSCMTGENRSLADVFAEKAVESALLLGFDGIYVMGVDWSDGEDLAAGTAELISALRKTTAGKRLEIFVEIDALELKNFPKIETSMLTHADYVVVSTNPFIKSIKHPLQGNYTIQEYKAHLMRLAQHPEGKAKILFSVHVMDIAEGWMSPAIHLQVEINEFASVSGAKGYAIYHVSRYLPVKLAVN